MATAKFVSTLTLLLLISSSCSAQILQPLFYRKLCPGAELTIIKVVQNAIQLDIRVAPALVRLFFHDCFVQGCDASILIQSPTAEITAIPNLTLVFLNIIDQAKAAVEAICPQIVSCADILAFSAATSLAALGGPPVAILGGRFDGLVSSAAEALAQIPAPFNTLAQLQASFSSKGLNDQDLVLLSGAHTIGQSHCSSFSNRLSGFNSTNNVDPSLNPNYAARLTQECPSGNSEVVMDPRTPNFFDNAYYQEVSNQRGLFTSDSQLYTSPSTIALVNRFASNDFDFLFQFAQSFVKMGQIGLKTSSTGNIRTTCGSFT